MSLKSELRNLKFRLNAGMNDFIQDTPNIRYHIKKEIKNDNEDFEFKNLQEIESLSDLQKFVKNSNICTLKNNATHTVFADGNPKSKLMLIGEAPGAEEDKYGKPFVGRAGQLLDKMLTAINLDRNKVYISNVVPWRPPNNRQPTTEEILQCLPFIQKHIEIINPSILILLGGTAAKALLTTNKGITRLRGQWHEYNNLGLSKAIPTRAIFHPAFLLRSPGHKKQAWEDLIAIEKKIISNENI